MVKNIFIIGSVYTNNEEDDKNSAVIPYYSSNGPGFNGTRGISFVAPGNAVTATPRFDASKREASMGTSFAAPNATGAIACLLSALKANSIKFSIGTIKTALEKTAFLPEDGDVLGFGNGIIQITDAFEFLKTYDDTVIQKYVDQKCELNVGKESKHGILTKCDKIKESYVVDISKNGASTFKNDIKLMTKNEKFFSHSEIENGLFSVKIDKDKLQSGVLNYAEILGINSDAQNQMFNKIFHLPVTVIAPRQVTEVENYCIKEGISLNTKTPNRFFLMPPKGSYYCIVTITVPENTAAVIIIQYGIENHTVDSQSRKTLRFDATTNKTQSHTIKIYWNRIHEISLTLCNTVLQEIKCAIEIQFYGLYVKKLKSEDEKEEKKDTNALRFRNYLNELNASMLVEFDTISYILVANDFVNENVKDQYDVSKIECLKLTYNFTVSKETKCSFKIDVGTKFKNYKSQIFTESKKFVFGFMNSHHKSVMLLPGNYTIVSTVFHTYSTKCSLPSVESLPYVAVTMELDEPLKPAVYSSKRKAKESKYTEERMIDFKNKEHKIYFKQIPLEKLPSPIPSTIVLNGSLNFCNPDTQLKVDVAHPYIFTLKKMPKSDGIKIVENTANKFSLEKLMDSLCLRECTQMLKKNGIIDGSKIIKQLYASLKEKNFSSFVKNFEMLQTSLKQKNENLDEKIKATIMSSIFAGTNLMLDKLLKEKTNIPTIFKENFELELINEKCISTSDNCNPNTATQKNDKITYSSVASETLTKAQKEINNICKFFYNNAQDNDIKKTLIQIKQALAFNRFGIALLKLNQISTKNQTNPKFKILDLAIVELLKQLEWKHLIEAHENALLDRHRNSYRLL